MLHAILVDLYLKKTSFADNMTANCLALKVLCDETDLEENVKTFLQTLCKAMARKVATPQYSPLSNIVQIRH